MTETFNTDLARRACIASLERRIKDTKAELDRLRARHGRSGSVARELKRMQERMHFLLMFGDPFMKVYS